MSIESFKVLIHKARGGNLKKFIVWFVAATIFAALAPALATAPPERARVIIVFKERPNAALIAGLGGDVIATYKIIPGVAARVPAGALEELRKNPAIAYIEPDVTVHALEQQVPWGISRIGAPSAWSFSTGEEVKVAILDTGIQHDHPDLEANVKGGISVVGENYSTDPADWNDGDGHGTHVAGIVAAVNNDVGVIGSAPAAWLYAVKVFPGREGPVSDVIEGIDWCVQNGMQVLNMSLGTDEYVSSFEDACDQAYEAGLLLVAAAGNDGDGNPNTTELSYPAAFDSVIAVSATDSDDQAPSWSNSGAFVELAAPGVSVYSTYKGSNYTTKSGTSMATPHVSGTAALVWAKNPSLANVQVRSILRQKAEDLGPAGKDTVYGYGLVRADDAMQTNVLTLRPNAGGEYTEYTTVFGAAEHWDAVNDVAPDEDNTYIETATAGHRDIFNLENSGLPDVPIYNVRVYARAENTATSAKINLMIRTCGNDYLSENMTLTSSYATYYEDWAENPLTGESWTFSEVDALQAGVRSASPANHRVTQVYVDVIYDVPTYGVDISTSPSYQSASRGKTLDYTVSVMNLGNIEDSYTLTATDNADWGPTLSDNSLMIPASENRIATLTVVIPPNALVGTEDNITVTATSQTDNTASASASCIAKVERAMLSVSPSSRSGSPGDNLLYAVTVANLRSTDDVYALSATDNKSWGLTFYENSLEIPAGGYRSTILRVAIPSGEPLGTVDNLTITITSLTDPEDNASVSCTARAGRMTLLPTEDAQVAEGYPDANYGDRTYVYVGNDMESPYKNERGFFKFDLSTIPENLTVADARLYNYCWSMYGATSENVQARAVDNDGWGELAITWNNQPPHGVILDTTSVPSTNSWYYWDFTSFVQSQFAGDNVASLCLRAEVENQVSPEAFAYALESKEYWEKRPYLEVLDASPLPLTVSISASYQKGAPGVRLDYAVAVTNTSDVSEKFNLSASDTAGWGLSLSPKSLTIAPGQFGGAKLSIFVPESAGSGDSTRVVVVATSSAGASDFSSSTATAWAGTRTGKVFISNPYQNYPYWYKGNLHSHTENSDGENTAAEMMTTYSTDGYSFNAITDHNYITDSEAFTDLPNFLGIDGEEDTVPSLHIVALDIISPINEHQSVSERVMDILGQGGVAMVAHPGHSWPLENVRQAVEAGARLMEIHGDPLPGLKSRQYWDTLLCENKLVYGAMNDDAHSTSQIGRWGWNMVNSESLSKSDILKSLTEGNFYCVESPPGGQAIGPNIYSITIENENVIVISADGDYVLFIGDNGVLLDNRELIGGVASHAPAAWPNYIRMEVHGGGSASYTQPLLVSAAKFNLDTLYKVGADLDTYIYEGSKLALKFYNYAGGYQGENIVWSGATPDNVSFSKIVPHPQNKAVEEIRLDLTAENTENVISTVGSFIVRKVTLEARLMEIPLEWSLAQPAGRVKLEIEYMEIPIRWALAPS